MSASPSAPLLGHDHFHERGQCLVAEVSDQKLGRQGLAGKSTRLSRKTERGAACEYVIVKNLPAPGRAHRTELGFDQIGSDFTGELTQAVIAGDFEPEFFGQFAGERDDRLLPRFD